MISQPRTKVEHGGWPFSCQASKLSSMSELSQEVIEHALSVARKHGFAEIELASGGASFRAKLDPIAKAKTKKGAAQTEPAEPTSKPLRASVVGYYAAAPRALKVGQKIKAGDHVANITALGISNDVEANVTGEIVEVLVTDGQPVEFGQTLALVKED